MDAFVGRDPDNRVTPPCKNGEMKTSEVHSLVERVAAVSSDCSDWGVLKAGVEDVRRLKSWVEGREVAFAQLTAKVSSFPEKSLAEAGARRCVMVNGCWGAPRPLRLFRRWVSRWMPVGCRVSMSMC